MIGELVDRVVSVIAPQTAARRVQARSVFRQMANRSYEAARTDRLNSNWRTSNRSADAELLESADIIRARARALVRDNAYARGAVRSLVRNVIGCGIKPQAATTNEQYNSTAERHFSQWQRSADITGRLSFYEMQALAYAEVIEAGEVLVRFVESQNRRRLVPLALELIESDRFATDAFVRGINKDTGNEVRRGVELNSNGEPVTYWLYSAHPSGVNSWRQQAKPFPADQFVHLFRQERVGQTRGVSAFAPVLWWVKNLGYYVENEMQASAIASCFTAAITTLGGDADGGLLDTIDSSSSDTDGNGMEYIQPGLVARLLPGEDVKVINPGRSHSEAKAWIDLMLRSIAVGTGISYERLSRDYSQTNYSSNRASDLEDRREFRPTQDWISTHLCEPTWTRFIGAAVEAELPGMPSAAEYLAGYDDWNAHVQHPPGWEWVDPVKEQRASADAISTNLSTLADELGKRGKDWREVLHQRSRERAVMQSLELPEDETEEQLMEAVTDGA